jgi:WD40 repeat protein
MTAWLTCLDVAVEQGLFAVGRADGTVILADLATARPRWVAQLHHERVSTVAFDADLLWTAGFDGTVVAAELADGTSRLCFDAGHGRILALRATHGALLTAGDDGHARLWHPATLAAVQTVDEQRFGPAYALALTPDWLAIGYQSGYVGIWRPTVSAVPVLTSSWQYEGHFQPDGRGPLYAIAVSPTSPLVAFARDRAVCLHEAGEWPLIERLAIPLACNDVQFDTSGTRLLGACSDREVRLWEWQPMVDSRYGYWPRLAAWLGEGMQAEPWSQAMIVSGARFAGDDRVISVSFDGAVRLFPARGPSVTPLRVARYGGKVPGSWED